MAAVVADTHAILWYLLDSPRLTPAAQRALDQAAEQGTLFVASITLVEVAYLVEKGRLPEIAFSRLLDALAADHRFAAAPLDLGVATAVRRVGRSQVPDMPDRIIGATAKELGLPLVSGDAQLRASDLDTIW